MSPAARPDQDYLGRPRLISNYSINMQPPVPLKAPHRSFSLRPKPAVHLHIKTMVTKQILDSADVFTTGAVSLDWPVLCIVPIL